MLVSHFLLSTLMAGTFRLKGGKQVEVCGGKTASGGMWREDNIYRDLIAHHRVTDAGSCLPPIPAFPLASTPEPISSLLLHSNEDLPILKRVEPALHQKSPLDPKGSKEEIETHGSKSITLEEHHEEAKAHKDHHMDILESCTE